MDMSIAKQIMTAVNEAEITNYDFYTDVGTHLYNTKDTAIAFLDEEHNAVISVQKRFTLDGPPYPGNLLLDVADIEDIHEFRCGGDYKTINKFIEAFGSSLTEEQYKLLLKIDRSNYDIKPETGDYVSFTPKSEAEVEAMTPEEKEEYEALLDQYKKNKAGFNQGMAVLVQC